MVKREKERTQAAELNRKENPMDAKRKEEVFP